ncbi:hypothetical protein HYH03_018543 [Edaphochlamys debaryana]|uniref:Uncharacterized protein n=1 Tax=Edaphochlamys debaryana TaxID=47281 RepID=A0A835XHQ0_9CHLO|nr:hypothetical protein HYH03_018543 [Edaphochlamys debaryana]|eukprot:KAG2482526.1 hypothetical protein HYH03_018543 [Edaphochlamys debaryana]
MSASLASRRMCSARGAQAASRDRRCAGRISTVQVRASYDVEVEPLPPRAPNSAPRFGGGPPPPPPPPPPPQRTGFAPPSRRELLFAGLGLALGAGGMYAIDNRPLDMEEVDERLTSILDDILDDEAVLNLLGEEVVLRRTMAEQDGAISALEGLKQLDASLGEIIEQAEKARK